jgi:hypothetical protein
MTIIALSNAGEDFDVAVAGHSDTLQSIQTVVAENPITDNDAAMPGTLGDIRRFSWLMMDKKRTK